MIDLLETGRDLFNSGRYFEAHERWEDLWRETRGAGRLFCQGLVQVAVGLHHRSQGNFRGGERVLRRGLAKLEAYPDSYMGLDNGRLREELRQVLAGGGPARVQIRQLAS